MKRTNLLAQLFFLLTTLSLFCNALFFSDFIFSNDSENWASYVNHAAKKTKGPVSVELTPCSSNFLEIESFNTGYVLAHSVRAGNSHSFFKIDSSDQNLSFYLDGVEAKKSTSLLFCSDNVGEYYKKQRYSNYLGFDFSSGEETNFEKNIYDVYLTDSFASLIFGKYPTIQSFEHHKLELRSKSLTAQINVVGILDGQSTNYVSKLYGSFAFCSFSLAQKLSVNSQFCSYFDGVDEIGDQVYFSKLLSIFPNYRSRKSYSFRIKTTSSETPIDQSLVIEQFPRKIESFSFSSLFFVFSILFCYFYSKKPINVNLKIMLSETIVISSISLFIVSKLEPLTSMPLLTPYFLVFLGLYFLVFYLIDSRIKRDIEK